MKNYILKLINFIPLFKRKYFHYVFHFRKGHKILTKNKNLHSFRSTKYNLNEVILNLTNFDKKIFQFYDLDIDNEKIIKQFINQKFCSDRIDYFYYYFLSSKKKFIYPLPFKMLNVIEKDGFKINKFLSLLSWFFVILLIFFSNLLGVIKLWLQIIKYLLVKRKSIKNADKTAVFCNISHEKDLLLTHANCGEYNLLNWARLNLGDYKFFFLNKKTKFLEEKSNYTLLNDHFLLILNHVDLRKYFIRSLGLIMSILKNIVLLRWWNLILFKEAAMADLYACANDGFAKKYIFVYLGNTFRPLWTYSAEKNGSSIELIPLGSFWEMSLPNPKIHIPDWEGYSIITWPIIYSWNESSRNFLINKTTNNPEIILLNKHVYSKDIKGYLNIPKRSIVVFSHENHRSVVGMSSIVDYQYANLNLLNSFYNDIYEILKKHNITMVIKRKSGAEKKNTQIKKNIGLFNSFKNKKDVIICNPAMSVDRVCQATLGTIALPFSSAAIVSNNYKKPTIFYDPIKWVRLDDPASSGLKIIYNKEDLYEWVKNLK